MYASCSKDAVAQSAAVATISHYGDAGVHSQCGDGVGEERGYEHEWGAGKEVFEEEVLTLSRVKGNSLRRSVTAALRYGLRHQQLHPPSLTYTHTHTHAHTHSGLDVCRARAAAPSGELLSVIADFENTLKAVPHPSTPEDKAKTSFPPPTPAVLPAVVDVGKENAELSSVRCEGDSLCA